MNKFVLDAYAWLEYFEGSNKGQLIREFLMNNKNFYFVNKLTFAEVISVVKRKGLNVGIASNAMATLSKVYDGDVSFYLEAGLLHAEIKKKIKDFGLADAFVLLTARKLNAKVITGDSHFKSFKNEVLLI